MVKWAYNNNIIFMNFRGREKKNFFPLYFQHTSMSFCSNFKLDHSLNAELNSTMKVTHFLMYFSFFIGRGPSKVCNVGTRWMQNLIMHPKISPDRNLSQNTGRYVKNTNKKVVFFFSSSKINKYYFIILTIILLIFFRRPILS